MINPLPSGRRRASLWAEALEPRYLLSTFDINGVQPAALDQPQIHALFRTTANGDPLSASDGLGGVSFDVQAFLDTGTSGMLLSQETAQGLGIASATSGGQPVVYSDVGVGGTETFDVSQPIYTALAPFIPTADIDNLATFPSVYNQTYGPVRTEIAQTPADELIGPLDILGVPLLNGKVMVMDPTPVNNIENMHTFVYNPGTPFNANAVDTDPGIPTTNRHVKLSYGSFDRFTQVTPTGAAGPDLAANPFIGPDPTLKLTPNAPADPTPPVQLAQGTHTSTGSFLFDTGAGASFISTAEAANLHVHYRAGTYNTDNPLLVDDNDVPLPNQFVIPLGGIGGTLNAAGFYMDSLTLPTTEGPGIRFVNAPVLVADISVEDPVTHQTLTLDGDFGMNFLVASADISGGLPDNITAGAFDWVVFDQPNGLLGLQVPGAPAVFDVPVANGDNAVYVKRNADLVHADFWINSATPGQGNPTQQILIADNQDFGLTAGAGNDRLTIDFSNGNPLPVGGLDYNGGGGVNTLAIVGTSADDTLTAGAAGVTFANAPLGSIPITTLNTQAIQFHGGSGGHDAIELTDGSYILDADTATGTPNVSVQVDAAATATFTTDQHLAALTINDGTALLPTTRHTMSLHTLSISGIGLLDIGNSFLYVDNTYSNTAAGGTQASAGGTAYAVMQQYVNHVYNLAGSANPGTLGDYAGHGGIGSSLAAATYAGGSVGNVSLVAYDGSQQDGLNPLGIAGLALGPNSNSGAGTGIPFGKTLIRPTLTGDLNGDGVVDDFDITLFSAYGLYKGNGTGPHTALGAQVGDFNFDGVVDDTDILIFSAAGNYLQAGFPPAAPVPAASAPLPSLTSATAMTPAAPSTASAYPAVARHTTASGRPRARRASHAVSRGANWGHSR